MKVLITGGSGFIGQALCRRLIEAGHQPLVVSRSPARARGRLPATVLIRPRIADFADEVPDAIVNLAGEPIVDRHWSAARKKQLLDSRINTTREVVDFCQAQARPPRVLVSASAVGYYGDQGSREVTEQTPPIDEFGHQICQRWEAEAMRAGQAGVRVAIVRIGLVLDHDGGLLAKTTPLFKLGLGGKLGDGRQYMPWIHRADIVGILLFLLEREDLSGAFNAAAPNPVSNAEFTRQLGRALKRPAVLPAPSLALRLILGERAQLLLTGAKMLPMRLQEAGYEFRYRHLEQALGALFKKR